MLVMFKTSGGKNLPFTAEESSNQFVPNILMEYKEFIYLTGFENTFLKCTSFLLGPRAVYNKKF